MMQQLKAKLKKQGGFTLIEMLIVVAIIAILIAISIPLVNGALEKARDATDQANERAAKAITLLHFMGVTEDEILEAGSANKEYEPGKGMGNSGESIVYYDAKTGALTYKIPTEGYGQCTNTTGCYCYDASAPTHPSHIGQVIQVTITDKGEFTPKWVTVTPAGP